MNDRWGHRRVPVAVPLLAVAWLLAACGPTVPTTAPISTTGPSAGPITAAPATTAPATEVPSGTTALPSAVSVAPACTAADLKGSHGLVEGAAGSRLTEIVLVAGVTCSIDAFPTLGLRDATGTAIVGGLPGGPGRIDLSPEASYASSVQLSNWCNPEPAFPTELTIRLAGEELVVTGGSFPDEQSGMPPCNGDSVAPTLEGTAWTTGG